jgi:metal-sulfur cluster biosynthetic enzyme
MPRPFSCSCIAGPLVGGVRIALCLEADTLHYGPAPRQSLLRWNGVRAVEYSRRRVGLLPGALRSCPWAEDVQAPCAHLYLHSRSRARGSRCNRCSGKRPAKMWLGSVGPWLTGCPGSQVGDVLSQLSQVMDPDLGADIVSLGFIKNLTIADGVVDFVLELTTPACPVKDQLKAQCETVVTALPWVTEASVVLSARPIAAQAMEGVSLMRASKGSAMHRGPPHQAHLIARVCLSCPHPVARPRSPAPPA